MSSPLLAPLTTRINCNNCYLLVVLFTPHHYTARLAPALFYFRGQKGTRRDGRETRTGGDVFQGNFPSTNYCYLFSMTTTAITTEETIVQGHHAWIFSGVDRKEGCGRWWARGKDRYSFLCIQKHWCGFRCFKDFTQVVRNGTAEHVGKLHPLSTKKLLLLCLFT